MLRSMCGADAGWLAINYQSLPRLTGTGIFLLACFAASRRRAGGLQSADILALPKRVGLPALHGGTHHIPWSRPPREWHPKPLVRTHLLRGKPLRHRTPLPPLVQRVGGGRGACALRHHPLHLVTSGTHK
ncbi:hypothetical protein T484DRAFT_2145740 [Baffinella frigidus]|nr:hypothetical protein T484DRAFT_2145740 [Cryptophyta sp. CCMP2293]